MAKIASIGMRVNPQIKAQAESIYGSLGMTLTEAINIFLHKSILEGDVRQPRCNSETEAAIHEARDILVGKAPAESYDSASTMFTALNE